MPIQLDGMQNLLNHINQIGRELESGTKEKALIAGAELLKEKVIENVPVRTGKLKDSIEESDVKDDSIEVGPGMGQAFYGHFVEFGTSKMPAQPFLQPAFENSKEEIQQKMADVVKMELNL